MEKSIKTESKGISGTIKSKHTYWLTRFMILRLLGIVYAVAFLVVIKEVIH